MALSVERCFFGHLKIFDFLGCPNQELTSTRGLPDALRTRILDHFKYKYRSGIMIKDSNIMAEMPDDMQAKTLTITLQKP